MNSKRQPTPADLEAFRDSLAKTLNIGETRRAALNLAGMDIAEKRKPQDRTYETIIDNKIFKLRLATTHTTSYASRPTALRRY